MNLSRESRKRFEGAAGAASTCVLIAVLALLLTWQDNSATETQFYVYRKECNPNGYNCGSYSRRFTLPANTTSMTDTTARHNRVSCYKVSALITGKEYFTNESCAYNR